MKTRENHVTSIENDSVDYYDDLCEHLDQIKALLKDASKKKLTAMAVDSGISHVADVNRIAAKAYETLGVKTAFRGKIEPFRIVTGQKKSVLIDNLRDKYTLTERYLSETLALLFLIAAQEELDLPDIPYTIDKMQEQLRALDGTVNELFEIARGKQSKHEQVEKVEEAAA